VFVFSTGAEKAASRWEFREFEFEAKQDPENDMEIAVHLPSA